MQCLTSSNMETKHVTYQIIIRPRKYRHTVTHFTRSAFWKRISVRQRFRALVRYHEASLQTYTPSSAPPPHWTSQTIALKSYRDWKRHSKSNAFTTPLWTKISVQPKTRRKHRMPPHSLDILDNQKTNQCVCPIYEKVIAQTFKAGPKYNQRTKGHKALYGPLFLLFCPSDH